jgi:hypothetical protein
MSFAQAFDEIFADIFGTAGRPVRPRLRKVGTWWTCSTPDGRCGIGLQPGQAYAAWFLMKRA